MIEFTKTIQIERPVQEVFDFISNFKNMSKWNYFVTDVQNITGEPPHIGTTYDQTRKTDRQQYKITEFEPNRLVSIKTIPPSEKLLMRFEFKPTEDGTNLIDTWELEKDLIAPLNWLAKTRVKSAVAENLEKLKELLETGSTTLQDGRVEHI